MLTPLDLHYIFVQWLWTFASLILACIVWWLMALNFISSTQQSTVIASVMFIWGIINIAILHCRSPACFALLICINQLHPDRHIHQIRSHSSLSKPQVLFQSIWNLEWGGGWVYWEENILSNYSNKLRNILGNRSSLKGIALVIKAIGLDCDRSFRFFGLFFFLSVYYNIDLPQWINNTIDFMKVFSSFADKM